MWWIALGLHTAFAGGACGQRAEHLAEDPSLQQTFVAKAAGRFISRATSLVEERASESYIIGSQDTLREITTATVQPQLEELLLRVYIDQGRPALATALIQVLGCRQIRRMDRADLTVNDLPQSEALRVMNAWMASFSTALSDGSINASMHQIVDNSTPVVQQKALAQRVLRNRPGSLSSD